MVALGVHERGRSRLLVVGAAEDARFRIASLTKPFVAQLALDLIAERVLELDAPALPGAPTVRQLLAHEGGVEPDLAAMEGLGEGSEALSAAVGKVLSRKRRFRAGSAWEYANSGYWIVADAVARATGAEFEHVLQERLLEPLGLSDTGWGEERLVPGHDERLAAVASTTYPRARRPSGGLVATIGDLVGFGVAALDGRRRVQRFDRRRATLFGARSALGWQLDPAGAFAYHDGDYGGFCARLAIVPAIDAVIAIVANTTAARHWVRQACDAILGDLSVPVASNSRRVATAFLAYANLAWARATNRG
jgi:CubicO group peptidase (beta-lactamase class C family)